MSDYPSIFNDVLGPVMRGPSSSHSAASLRIALLCRDLMDGDIENVLIEFDIGGSLATTHKSQGSDMGLFGGFLGWQADDARLPDYEQAIADASIDIEIKLVDEQWQHPNTYKLTLRNDLTTREVMAISHGGGMIEITSIDTQPISIVGDYHELLIFTDDVENVLSLVAGRLSADHIDIVRGEHAFIEVKSHHGFSDNVIAAIKELPDVTTVKYLSPVLPVLSRRDMTVPFGSESEMLAYNGDKNLSLAELATQYEAERAKLSQADVRSRMGEIVTVMRNAIDTGLAGTDYSDRILGCQSKGFKENLDANKLIASDALNNAILYVTALMEVKSAMGVIVAAPTAGSCGALAGAVLAVADTLEVGDEKIIDAMLVAGLIGVFIASGPGFAAENGGGTLEQSLAAASMALQNSLGMICDPIGNRVEAPCLGRNTMAASNALSCANMALSGYAHLIPLDEVIGVMQEVADKMHRDLKCTALGGLSMTKAALEIEKQLGDEIVRTPFKSC